MNYTEPLSKVTEELKQQGFTDQFQMEESKLKSTSTGQHYAPGDITIEKHFRFEGTSDPSAMTILYAVSTNSGNKGTVVNAFGTYGDSDLNDFMKEVEEKENANKPK